MPLYLDPQMTPRENLEMLARGGYTTEAEEAARKRVLEDHFGVKTFSSLCAAVACVALGIILGPSLISKVVMLSVIIPVTIGFSFHSKHRELEIQRDIEYGNCLEIIQNISNYLNELCQQKKDYIAQFPEKEKQELKKIEEDFDSKNQYGDVAKYARRGVKVIERHSEVYEDADYSSWGTNWRNDVLKRFYAKGKINL